MSTPPDKQQDVQIALEKYIAELRAKFTTDGFTAAAKRELLAAINTFNIDHLQSPEDARLTVDMYEYLYKQLIENHSTNPNMFANLRIGDGIYIERPVDAEASPKGHPLHHARNGILRCKRGPDNQIIFSPALDIGFLDKTNQSRKGALQFFSGMQTVCMYAYEVTEEGSIIKIASLKFPDKATLTPEIAHAIALNNKVAAVSPHASKITLILDAKGNAHRFQDFFELGDLNSVMRKGFLESVHDGQPILDRSIITPTGIDPPISIETCKVDLMFQYAELLSDQETAEVAHNDMKLENTFAAYDAVQRRIILVAGDYQLATEFKQSEIRTAGTHEYVPPEAWKYMASLVVQHRDAKGESLTAEDALYTLLFKLYDRYDPENKGLSANARTPIYGAEVMFSELGLTPELMLQLGKAYHDGTTLSAYLQDKESAAIKTLEMMLQNFKPPEEYKNKGDIYTVGLIFSQLFGEAFPDSTSINSSNLGRLSFTSALLNKDPAQRMSGRELLKKLEGMFPDFMDKYKPVARAHLTS